MKTRGRANFHRPSCSAEVPVQVQSAACERRVFSLESVAWAAFSCVVVTLAVLVV